MLNFALPASVELKLSIVAENVQLDAYTVDGTFLGQLLTVRKGGDVSRAGLTPAMVSAGFQADIDNKVVVV